MTFKTARNFYLGNENSNYLEGKKFLFHKKLVQSRVITEANFVAKVELDVDSNQVKSSSIPIGQIMN